MNIDARRALRGAAAGAFAAGVWAAQQRADIAVFGVRYDDTELLGKLVTRSEGWRPIGLAMHIANGAAFGAVYAVTAGSAPGPGWAKGAAAGLAENFATWPLTPLVDRFHPARKEIPQLSGDSAALAQATWRHALFGVVMGVVEERLNRGSDEREFFNQTPPAATNGHGDIARAAALQD